MQPWFIYILYDPRKPEVVRYVGSTRDPAKRLAQHIAGAKRGERTYCGNWKRSLLEIGIRPGLRVIEEGRGEDWPEVEIRWIAHYREQGAPLTNRTEGGEGFRGKHTSETRVRMSLAKKGRPKSRTLEHEMNLRAALKARQYTPEVRAKMRESHLGKTHSAEHRSKISSALKTTLAANPELRLKRSASSKSYADRPEEKARRSARLTELWGDPEKRALRIAAIKKARK